MKQTNYHLFDFMDFDPTLQRDESLWKAYAPTKIVERDGDIIITIPYQKQRHQEDMEPDTDTPQQTYDLIIRAYEPNIIRLFTTMTDDEMTDHDEMLQMAPAVKRQPLRLHGSVCCDIVAANDKKVATINLEAPRLDHWSDLLPAPQPAPFITFYPDGDTSKPVALSDDHFSPPRYDALPLGFCSVSCCATATTTERATISFRCDANEHFVGTGERFRKMDLSGQTFQLKNQDGQGVNNRRCYKNIPFYLSSRMYGVFYHTSDYCKLSLADHSARSVQFMCDRATLDVFLIGGQTPEEILRGYRMLTGFPAMPPLWSFGIWMSRMTYFSADEVEDICHRLREEHYPCDVIHLDTGWFRTDWLCEWKFNPERFPAPKAFISRLKEQGFKVSLWQLPYIAQGAEQLEEAKQNKYISQPTREEDTSTGGASNFSALDYAGTIDFTYPKATDWYKYTLLKPLLDMGVKCIKTDFGENIHMDHQYHASTPERLNNIYALLYQKAAYEVTREVTGDGIIWARAGWAGCQRYPLHWGGDSESSWAGMAGSLKGGLHLGLSGFAFWSHDVPGFHSTPDFMNSPLDEQVYVRWTQFGVFTSHMRYHGTCKREPWHYPEIAPIVKRWWKLRYRLLPYIVEQSELACQSGLPLVQALLFHHPHDRQVWHIDDEYYFGNELLVCPVMNADNRRDIYLPEGPWVNFLTGERLEGGRWYYQVEVPLDQMPVFVRPDAVIKMYPHDVDSTDDMDLSQSTDITITHNFKGITL
ncbi:MAG: alpha-xylosidase [Prevotella sp.]|nr:alpha-xylosidase [Prevotella sp.]